MSVSDEDFEIMSRQLGRKIRGAIEVSYLSLIHISEPTRPY